MTMSPQSKQRWKNTLLTASALVSAGLVLVGAFKPVLRPVAKNVLTSTLDSQYVTQQSYEKDTLLAGVSHKQEVDSILRMLRDDQAMHARTDSALRCFIRRNKPEWCS